MKTKISAKVKCVGNDATTNGCTCPQCAAHDAAHAAHLARVEAEFRARYPFPYSVAQEDAWLILSSWIEDSIPQETLAVLSAWVEIV